MSAEINRSESKHRLNIHIYEKDLSVSYISSLLRTLQAAIREIAISDASIQNDFNEEKRHIFVISNLTFDTSFNPTHHRCGTHQ